MRELRVSTEAFRLVMATLLMLVLAVAVVISVHVSRQKVSALQSLQRATEDAQVQWGQLLLEKSAWGSYAHVENTAHAQLDMYVPSVKEIVVVGP